MHPLATHTRPRRTDQRMAELVASLRRLQFTAPKLGEQLGMPVSTTSGIPKRIGIGKLGWLGLEPAQRHIFGVWLQHDPARRG